MRYTKLLLLMFVFSMALSLGQDGLLSQVPQTLSYQGILTDAESNAVPDGNYTLTFRLYTGPNNSALLWEETHPVRSWCKMDSSTSFWAVRSPLDLPFDQPYSLGISIGDDSELTPRIELTATAYSLHARSIADSSVSTDKIRDGAITQSKLASGVALPPGGQAGGDLTGTFPNPTIATGAVTTEKLAEEAVNRSKIAEEAINDTKIDSGQVVKSLKVGETTLKDDVTLEAGSNVTIIPDGNRVSISAEGGMADADWTVSGDNIIAATTGNVGIGTAEPKEKLDVTGNIKASGLITSGNSITLDGLNSRIAADRVFEFHVSGERAFRVESASDPEDGFSPNVIGGFSGNTAADGIIGATIAGGGASEAINSVTADHATIGGGQQNVASKFGSTVAGGARNSAAGGNATIGGGSGNEANGDAPTVSVGDNNIADNSRSTVSGGEDNTASGIAASIGGGELNTADGNHAIVGGGVGHQATAPFATIAGGGWTQIGNIATANRVTDLGGTVSGGANNQAGDDAGSTTDIPYATVGGGRGNNAAGILSTVGGGSGNTASGTYATVGGGVFNQAIGNFSAIGGGGASGSAFRNKAIGDFSVIPGGTANSAFGDYSFAAGRQAKANHEGAFVWSDATADTEADSFFSTAKNQFLIRATGGVGIGTNSPHEPLSFKNETGTKINLFDGGNGIYGFGMAPAELQIGTFDETKHISLGHYSGSSKSFVELMRIEGNGKVGIGATNPQEPLSFANELGTKINLFDTGNGIYGFGMAPAELQIGTFDETKHISLGHYSGSSKNFVEWMRVDAGGNLGIGTKNPQHPLEFGNGAHVTAGGVWKNSSSRERKENIADLTETEAMSALEELNPVKFNYRVEKQEEYVGFIAENVPELVANRDRKSLSTMDIVAVLTKIVQSQ